MSDLARISELVPGTPPYPADSLLEISVPDVGSPSGYISRSALLDDIRSAGVVLTDVTLAGTTTLPAGGQIASDGRIAIRNTPQADLTVGNAGGTARSYNQFTDAGNSEWAYLGDWGAAAGIASYGTGMNGTGLARDVQFVRGGVQQILLGSGGPVVTGQLATSTLQVLNGGAGAAQFGVQPLPQIDGLLGQVSIGGGGSTNQSRGGANTTGPTSYYGKSRGTSTLAGAVTSGDFISRLVFCGDDGSTNGNITIKAAEYRVMVEGTVSTGIVPAKHTWFTMNAAGTLGQRMQLSAAGGLTVGGSGTVDPGSGGILAYTNLMIGSAMDVVLVRDGATGVLAQRNGVNPQLFRVYHTYTDNANFERGAMSWLSNVLTIGSQHNGTGSARDVSLVRGGVEQIRLAAALTNIVGQLTVGATPAVSQGTLHVNSSDSSAYSSSVMAAGVRGVIMNTDLTVQNTARLAFASTDTGAITRFGAALSCIFTARGAGSVTCELALQLAAAGATTEIVRFASGGVAFNVAVVQKPAASVVPANNGELTVEATSNTQLTFRFKGSDGTVRSNTLTLA